MKCISLASGEDALEVSALRCGEFAREFAGLDVTKIPWSKDDELATVLIAKDEHGRAVATMRAQFAWTLEVAEAATENRLDMCHFEWPAMVLERAATRVDFRGRGLNSALRFHFIAIALKWEVPTLLGGVVSGAARTRSMRQMGYTFVPNDREWQDVRTDRPTESAVLNLKTDGRRALDYLARTIAPCLDEFPWSGDYPQRPWR